jgi:hypothetical protein
MQATTVALCIMWETACSIVFGKLVEHCKNMTLLGTGNYAKASDA